MLYFLRHIQYETIVSTCVVEVGFPILYIMVYCYGRQVWVLSEDFVRWKGGISLYI